MKLVLSANNGLSARILCERTLNYNVFSKLFQSEIPRLSGWTLASWTLTEMWLAVLTD
jgi:hypothetical protein